MTGYKTYAAAAVMVIVAVAKLAGIDVPGFEMMDPGALLTQAAAVAGLRHAIS
jgi:hypothetical protein